MLLDVSGSMASWQVRVTASWSWPSWRCLSSLDEFKPEDELGLWVFSTKLDGDLDYLELIPPAPLSEIRDDLEDTSRVATCRRRNRSL